MIRNQRKIHRYLEERLGGLAGFSSKNTGMTVMHVKLFAGKTVADAKYISDQDEQAQWKRFVNGALPVNPLKSDARLHYDTDGRPILPKWEDDWNRVNGSEVLLAFLHNMWAFAYNGYPPVHLDFNAVAIAPHLFFRSEWCKKVTDPTNMKMIDLVRLYQDIRDAQFTSEAFIFAAMWRTPPQAYFSRNSPERDTRVHDTASEDILRCYDYPHNVLPCDAPLRNYLHRIAPPPSSLPAIPPPYNSPQCDSLPSDYSRTRSSMNYPPHPDEVGQIVLTDNDDRFVQNDNSLPMLSRNINWEKAPVTESQWTTRENISDDDTYGSPSRKGTQQTKHNPPDIICCDNAVENTLRPDCSPEHVVAREDEHVHIRNTPSPPKRYSNIIQYNTVQGGVAAVHSGKSDTQLQPKPVTKFYSREQLFRENGKKGIEQTTTTATPTRKYAFKLQMDLLPSPFNTQPSSRTTPVTKKTISRAGFLHSLT
ncbi:uncharacterized protein TRAVEDRAFT_19500 [Trametes versicolor FP-101664 SS1]|uniref:uncharacterized protein n=1 Tax=Trametes versicolor (strain FP-101664) TaxID=717944 RepID=UPI0004622FA7|nr:uncharacterized protein TRAVEDRAFT_19500 [Trametes versicolor FP-101664 SS1]EIW60986.1 hypothetical protein TRAVEDRAFT_19500 [Trametes versicolor FP-101664 SS1]